MCEYDALCEKLIRNKDLEIEDVKREEIEDVKNININKNVSPRERTLEYLKKVENPYILKINGILVKITFGNKNIDFKQCISNIVKNNI